MRTYLSPMRRSRRPTARSLWVVVPAHNEAGLIAKCLDSLAGQTDQDFQLVVIDNASTDATHSVVEAWMSRHPGVRSHLVSEDRKGTGAAADTGFRFAIERGADWVARTDADCLVAADWVENVRMGTSGSDMLGGKIRARTDDVNLTWFERAYIPVTVTAARLFGKLRPSNRGAQYRCPYVMCVGNNLAVAASVYEASGGFPRLAIEELSIPNDRALVNRVRTVSALVYYAPKMIVYNSARRLRAYGMLRTLVWYAKHRLDNPTTEVDIR